MARLDESLDSLDESRSGHPDETSSDIDEIQLQSEWQQTLEQQPMHDLDYYQVLCYAVHFSRSSILK